MNLPEHTRKAINVMRQKGLGWEDVCFLMRIIPDQREKVKLYYFRNPTIRKSSINVD